MPEYTHVYCTNFKRPNTAKYYIRFSKLTKTELIGNYVRGKQTVDLLFEYELNVGGEEHVKIFMKCVKRLVVPVFFGKKPSKLTKVPTTHNATDHTEDAVQTDPREIERQRIADVTRMANERARLRAVYGNPRFTGR